jgi:tetratricopeptide (TPR) repeat protein
MAEPDILEQVRRAIDAGMRPQAARLAREAAPELEPARMLELGSLLSDHAMFKAQIDCFRRRRDAQTLTAREHEPFATALNALAMTEQDEGRTDTAMTLLDEAMHLAPNLRYLRRNVASCLLAKGEFEGALGELDTLLSADPDDFDSLLLLGITRYQSSDPELAAAPLQQAFNAGLAEAGLWLTKALALSGKHEEARDALKRLKQEHPDRAQAMLELEQNEPGSPIQTLL